MPTKKFLRPRTAAEFVEVAKTSPMNIKIDIGNESAEILAFWFEFDGKRGGALFAVESGFLAGQYNEDPFTSSQDRDGELWFDALLHLAYTNDPKLEAA